MRPRREYFPSNARFRPALNRKNIKDFLLERVEFELSGDLTVYPHCGAGALISFRANAIAAKLYMSLGFVETSLDDDEFGEPNYKLAGAALDKYR